MFCGRTCDELSTLAVKLSVSAIIYPWWTATQTKAPVSLSLKVLTWDFFTNLLEQLMHCFNGYVMGMYSGEERRGDKIDQHIFLVVGFIYCSLFIGLDIT